MNLSICPYCSLPGLVTTVKSHGSSLDVTGKCTTCGYSYDSEYAPSESTNDLPGEFTRSLDITAAD